MNPRARLGILAPALAAAVAMALVIWQPWSDRSAVTVKAPSNPPPPTIDLGSLTLTNAATLKATNKTGGPCKLTLDGAGGFQGHFTSELAAGESNSVLHVSAPFTVESLTVDRAGKSHRHELKLTLTGGETREIVINADDSVEIVPAGK